MAEARAAADAARRMWVWYAENDRIRGILLSDDNCERMCVWSERWYQAQAAASGPAAGRREALRQHLARLDGLDDRLLGTFDAYERTDRLRVVVKYYRQRALSGIDE